MAAPKTGDISDMQFYYDKCLPGNSTMMNNFDAVTMRLTDISLNVKDCILDMSKSVAAPKDQKTTNTYGTNGGRNATPDWTIGKFSGDD